MIPHFAVAAVPPPEALASWISVLMYLGGFIATLIGSAVGVKKLRERPPQQTIVSPQPLEVKEATTFATKPELAAVDERLGGEIHQLHGRISSVRNEVTGKVDALDARIDAIPQRTIELLKTVKEYHKS